MNLGNIMLREKKADTEGHIVYDNVYGKCPEVESWFVVSSREEKQEYWKSNCLVGAFGVMKMFCKVDRENVCTTLGMY